MKEFKRIVLTGDRPTGKLHLGHYVGSIENRLKLQNEYSGSCFYMVADVQALTDNADNPEKVRNNMREVVIDNLACGLDPNKVNIFIQSLVPEIAELTVFFLNLVTVARLQRNPTVKDEIKQKGFNESVPAGFFMYPVSQAADILFAKATIVPVGEDQKPMIEQANEISHKFNSIYGEVFPHITAVIPKVARLRGLDGNAKMSKSLNNAIYLSDSDDEIRAKVKQMYTDPGHIKITDPGKVEGNVVFEYLDIFDDRIEAIKDLKTQYEKGGLGDVELKNRLSEVLIKLISPIRERREELEKNPEYIDKVIKEGTEAARKVAKETMNEVRRAMKIDYFS